MPRKKTKLKKQQRSRGTDPETSSSSSSSSDIVSDMCYPDVEKIEREVRGEWSGDRGVEVTVVWAGQVVGRRALSKFRERTLTLSFTDELDLLHCSEGSEGRGGGGSGKGSWRKVDLVFRIPTSANNISNLNSVSIMSDDMFNLFLTNTQDTYLGTSVESMRQLFSECDGQKEGTKKEKIFNYLEFRYLLETWKRFKAIGIPKPEIDLVPDTLYLGFDSGNKNRLFIKIIHLTAREHLVNINMVSLDRG
ncbi:hypothetical protein ACHWQZ_G007812 [Mnemiopsis leidyi]